MNFTLKLLLVELLIIFQMNNALEVENSETINENVYSAGYEPRRGWMYPHGGRYYGQVVSKAPEENPVTKKPVLEIPEGELSGLLGDWDVEMTFL